MSVERFEGGMHRDARGALRFCNGFDMAAVKRFYTIANSAEAPRRGWIGHRRETKWFFPLRGATTLVVEPMEPAPAAGSRRTFALDAARPEVLKVPGGHWFCIEQQGEAEVMVFSDCRCGEYEKDDFRRPL